MAENLYAAISTRAAMRPTRSAARIGGLAALGAAALLLAACETQKPTTVACPRVLVDEDVGNLTRFRDGPGRDITDIVVRSEISRIAGACEVTDEFVNVEFGIELAAERGAAGSGRVNLPLFVAVVDEGGTVIDRQSFSETADFSGNRSQTVLRDVFTIAIPRKQGAATDSHRIYAGFELTRDEVSYNREQTKR